jgi:hypothetical protein
VTAGRCAGLHHQQFGNRQHSLHGTLSLGGDE